MSRVLGHTSDEKRKHLSETPTVLIEELPPEHDILVVLCSDGVSDALWTHQFGEIFKSTVEKNPHATGQQVADAVLAELEANKSATFGFVKSYLRGVKEKRPMWDDISLWCARFQGIMEGNEEKKG